MKDTSTLPTSPAEISELITDAVRFAEGLLTEAAVRKKWGLAEDIWTALGNNEEFVEKIEAERAKRIRNGDAARERAQRHFAVAPDILGSILHDNTASPRHRIESARELRTVANNGPEAAPPEIFRIVINLGADKKLQYSGSVRPTPCDPVTGKIIEHAPQELLAIAAANKREDNGSGQPV